MRQVLFLTLAEVIEIHADQIERYGGQKGIRDINLLSSALAMPQASFEGTFLHPTLVEMAAAYAYHLSQNHPFVDGNKRTGLAASLVFLELNGVTVSDPKGRLYEAMMVIASGKLSKGKLTTVLRGLTKRP
jgi:death-on-curing protein